MQIIYVIGTIIMGVVVGLTIILVDIIDFKRLKVGVAERFADR